MEMIYHRTHLKQTITINKIITMYYFEFGKDYIFRGEAHDFWEFLYVDRGDVEVWADDRCHRLEQGTMIFHKPNEFHKFYAKNAKAPNLIVMTFDCRSAAMKRFENAVIRLDDEERNLLAQIVREGMSAFHFPFRHPLKRRSDAPVGAEQLVKLYLETLLIRLLRRNDLTEGDPAKPLSFAAKEKIEDELVKQAIECLHRRIDSHITLAELCETLHVAKTRLKELFKRTTGLTVMDYYAKLKIEKAKLLIREATYNFTEISAMLGFSSVHVFSKAFKRTTGMSPSEYARTVKARLTSRL